MNLERQFLELKPKYFLNKNWRIYREIAPALRKKGVVAYAVKRVEIPPREREWKKWIKSTRIEVARAAETTELSADDKNEYLKTELGMNIIIPKGTIDELRLKITLKGDGRISDEVIAIDGFPKGVIKEKEIIGGKIKVGITKLFKFIPVVGDVFSDLLEIDLNPWEFRFGSIRKVKVAFSGGLTPEPEWYFQKDGFKDDLRLALTIKKPKRIKLLEGNIRASWVYDPGFFKKAIIETDTKKVKIY